MGSEMCIRDRICMGAPFYVLGPLVTDIAPGYDHITAAIGGAVAAMSGAAFLCYVTPAEHLALPNVEDTKQGIIASKIAAHAADIAKGIPGARDIDDKMADARRVLDWDAQFECALDPETAKAIRDSRKPEDAIREGLALVTEDRKLDGFVGGMSIEENITLASLKAICRYGIINHKKEQLSARKYFDELKIKAADMTVHMETLSGGNQQKAVLSKWLMTKPRVLIMDEPTRGIDVGTKYEIYKIMVELARQGIAIIMISSELPELISMSDRIIVLSGGKVSGELQQEDASQEKVMELATRMVV